MTEKRPKLGEMLVEAGIIDERQLKSALTHQRHWRCLFGASLVKLGYVDEEQLLDFLADRLGLLRVDLRWRPIVPEVLASVPAAKAREYTVIPVDREIIHGTVYLLVAMCDPTNLDSIDDLAFISGCRIRPALASEMAILQAIERCYGRKDEAEQTREHGAEQADRWRQLLDLLLEKQILSPEEHQRLK